MAPTDHTTHSRGGEVSGKAKRRKRRRIDEGDRKDWGKMHWQIYPSVT